MNELKHVFQSAGVLENMHQAENQEEEKFLSVICSFSKTSLERQVSNVELYWMGDILKIYESVMHQLQTVWKDERPNVPSQRWETKGMKL